MAQAIKLDGITSGAVTSNGETIYLRAPQGDERIDLVLPAKDIENTGVLLIRLAHEAAGKRGDDEEGGFLVDAVEVTEFDDDNRSTLIQAWSLGAPISFVVDETLLVELEEKVRERLKAIRES